MVIFLFPSPTTGLSTRQILAQHVNSRYFRQQVANVREFACDFLIKVDLLDYSEADIKNVFNTYLDQPLSLWEMEKLGNLGFWDFVYRVYHRGEPEPPPQTKSHPTDCPPFPSTVSGSPSPSMTRNRRRKNWPSAVPPEATGDAAAPPEAEEEEAAAPLEVPAEEAAAPPVVADEAAASRSRRRRRKRKASSVPQGLEAIQELAAGPCSRARSNLGAHRDRSRARSGLGAHRACSRARSGPGSHRIRSRAHSSTGAHRVCSRTRSSPGAHRAGSTQAPCPVGAAQAPGLPERTNLSASVQLQCNYNGAAMFGRSSGSSAQIVLLSNFLRIFAFPSYTHNICTDCLRQKNTFGHWTPLH